MGAVVSGFIFGLLFISGFAGLLPVGAGGVWDKWLIISVFLVLLICYSMLSAWCYSDRGLLLFFLFQKEK